MIHNFKEKVFQEATRPTSRLPTLSVVVPNYNHGHYLREALLAHLNQQEPVMEIIVVDDASTDKSCDIVRQLLDIHKVIRLISLKKNSGVNAAINRGLQEARGDYVCVSAADDVVSPEFTRKAMLSLAQHPSAGFCFSDPGELLGDSGVIRRIPLYLSNLPCMFNPDDFGRILKKNFFSFSSNTIIYKRKALLEINGFLEDLKWYGDSFANFVLAFRYGACYIPEVLAFFRVSEGSYSARGTRQASDQRALLFRVLDLLKEVPYRDVAPRFRRAAIVPEMRPRTLLWVLLSQQHREHVTARLFFRLLAGGLWSVLMPHTPNQLRRLARWILGSLTRHRFATRA